MQQSSFRVLERAQAFIFFVASCCLAQNLFAQSAAHPTDWEYSTTSKSPDASDVWLPLASFFLPGTGQWARGQTVYGATYSGSALFSLRYATYARAELESPDSEQSLVSKKQVSFRKYMLGLQTYQAIGGLSLYHTFRSAVWQRQKHNEYNFLGQGDSIKEILTAPLNLQFLKRSSTWIPLAAVSAFSWYATHHFDSSHQRSKLQKEDPWFALGYSYNAGTHEEAIFRGWVMPLMHEAGFSRPVANMGQSALFAMMHLSSNPLPLPQFFLGLHLGNVTQRNQWSLSEAIFIHTWWDVIAFLAAYSIEEKQEMQNKRNINLQKQKANTHSTSSASKRGPSFHFPPLVHRF